MKKRSAENKVKRENESIASRTLLDKAGRKVHVTLFRPQLDKQGDWECRIEIDREGGAPILRAGHGVDSLQALIQGIQAIRFSLDGKGRNLTWLRGARGHVGLPLMIEDHDPDFVTLVEHLLEAEYCRQLMAAKRHPIRKRKLPPRAGRKRAKRRQQ